MRRSRERRDEGKEGDLWNASRMTFGMQRREKRQRNWEEERTKEVCKCGRVENKRRELLYRI